MNNCSNVRYMVCWKYKRGSVAAQRGMYLTACRVQRNLLREAVLELVLKYAKKFAE